MYKFFIKVVIIIFLINSISLAEIVNKVEINGNQRISKATIITLGVIKKNINYDNDELNRILKNLYDTNFFNDIELKLSDGTLLINLSENPIIENIEISGIKKKELTEILLEKIVLKNRMSFTENQLLKDTNLIKNILKTSGYYFAKVDTSFSKDNELNSIRLKINIDLGEKAKIKKISFIGDKKVKDKKLLEVIASEEHKFWKFISNKVYLNQSTIELDKRLLENYYKNLGYYKVKILNSFSEFSDQGYFKLLFNIESGNQYFFNNFNLNLPEDYNKSDFKKIEKIFNKLKNENYSLDNLNLILKEIDKIASERLYDFIDAKVEEEIIENNKINFTFNIIDSDKFYVEKINILGNFQTIEEVIRNRLIVDEGDPLNNLLYAKSIDNIKSLRIFKSVKSEIKEGSDSNLKVVDIIVEEQPTGEVSLLAGVGTTGTTVGGGIVEKNFLGKGINLETNLEISEETIKGKFVYSKPNFAYTDNT